MTQSSFCLVYKHCCTSRLNGPDTIQNLNKNILFFNNNKLDKQRQVDFFEKHQLTHADLVNKVATVKDVIDLTEFNNCHSSQTILESKHHSISGRRIQALADGFLSTGSYLLLLSVVSMIIGVIFFVICCTILNTALPMLISFGIGTSLTLIGPAMSAIGHSLLKRYGNQDQIELNAEETFLPTDELESSFSL